MAETTTSRLQRWIETMDRPLLGLAIFSMCLYLLDLHGPVGVRGKIRDPQVSLGRVFPIPTPTVGTAKNVDCPAVTQQLFAPQGQAPDVARAI